MSSSKRDYKDEYDKFQRAKTHYRSALNKEHRKNKKSKKGDGKDASHGKDGKISLVAEGENRGRSGEGGRKKGKSHNYPANRKA